MIPIGQLVAYHNEAGAIRWGREWGEALAEKTTTHVEELAKLSAHWERYLGTSTSAGPRLASALGHIHDIAQDELLQNHSQDKMLAVFRRIASAAKFAIDGGPKFDAGTTVEPEPAA